MERADKDLAFMLQYENIAWYEQGKVRILDRRIYPTRVEFHVCENHVEVTKAITDMVTQSAGPFTAAAMGMALAAYECRGRSEKDQKEYLKKAADTISHARPTTIDRMTLITKGCYLGQEIVARVHNLGKPPKRLVVKSENECNEEEKQKMTSKCHDPETGKTSGFLLIKNISDEDD